MTLAVLILLLTFWTGILTGVVAKNSWIFYGVVYTAMIVIFAVYTA